MLFSIDDDYNIAMWCWDCGIKANEIIVITFTKEILTLITG